MRIVGLRNVGSLLLVASMLSALLAGCGDDDPAIATPNSANNPAYLQAGPYPVGSLSFDLNGRSLAVFYPVQPGSEVGQSHAHYRQTDPIRDTFLKGVAERLAQRKGINLDYEMRVYGDLPAAAGRFPVILFSHGFGGWRLVNSNLMAGIASWGFVIASADHIERDLNAVATMTVSADVNKDRAVLLDALHLLQQQDALPGSRLQGHIDADHVAAAGHSAGGAAALSTIALPEIDAIVGYASVGNVNDPPSKPTLLLSASGDIAVTADLTASIFNGLKAPKRSVVISQTGHNSFTDLCDAIRSGATLTQLARDANFPISDQLLALAENGCAETDLPPSDCWAISQHFTVAHLRQAFGIDAKPVGLGSGIRNVFVTPIDYTDVH